MRPTNRQLMKNVHRLTCTNSKELRQNVMTCTASGNTRCNSSPSHRSSSERKAEDSNAHEAKGCTSFPDSHRHAIRGPEEEQQRRRHGVNLPAAGVVDELHRQVETKRRSTAALQFPVVGGTGREDHFARGPHDDGRCANQWNATSLART
jgi:hypothetical protein